MTRTCAKTAYGLVVAMMLCAAPAVCAGGSKKDNGDPTPPPPDPANPVNYIDWMNDTFGVPARKNAAPLYRKAYKLFQPFDGDWKQVEHVAKEPWSKEKAVSDWLGANAESLRKFRKATKRKRCYFKLDEPKPSENARFDPLLVRVMAPVLTPHRMSCRALLAEGFRAWQQGDHDRLVDNAMTVLKASHHMDSSPELIMRLVSTASAAPAYDALRKVLDLSEDREESAKRILAGLRKVDPHRVPFRRVLLFERAAMWDLCQRGFRRTDEKSTWEFVDPGGLVPGQESLIAGIGYESTLQEYNAYYDLVDAWADRPFHEAVNDVHLLTEKVEGSKNPLVKKTLPSFQRIRDFDAFLLTERRATRLILHLLLYGKKAGGFPESLNDLDVEDLDEIRIDPMSGKDFVYKKQRDGFKLYSVGANLVDDGGKRGKSWRFDEDRVFWPDPD